MTTSFSSATEYGGSATKFERELAKAVSFESLEMTTACGGRDGCRLTLLLVLEPLGVSALP
jgi:hypothetical protein